MTDDVKRLRVDLGERGYEIIIGDGVLRSLGEEMRRADLSETSHILLVTDEHVSKAGHLEVAKESLEQSGYSVTVVEVPPGEESKNLDQAERLYDAAFNAGLDRRSTIIALGGGVVGDLAGFVAATYMRGISFVQVPTTVLAHDSAVGGKVAVNHPRGKNIIGAFHQPEFVLYDVNTLRTLPPREIRSGIAEVIKHGLIWDREFFFWIERNMEEMLSLDSAILVDMLARSCAIKAAVVAKDEKEQGLRAILNYGHTLAHAIEGLAGYGVFTHGEAVSIGIAFAAELSSRLGYLSSQDLVRTERCLLKAGLPVHIPASLSTNELVSFMRQDKKAIGKTLTFVIAEDIGRVSIVKDVPLQSVIDSIDVRRERAS
ncbi:3-dehydroquinate synthase [Collibacillus ludicampi]|jgi:3-dehydroquinate synthase|uniref:3-dehydroquinate synthase n=1 Tax=Collibacillus ludicampi TaxID=2771369 RepID=A0AAV4LKQ3_9BACL|nr:3-dehydroquinate synthase [Collibacillus ludicampi]GIM48178.1 3-dehydroquinate synthase [Collibacillus ludicampi]